MLNKTAFNYMTSLQYKVKDLSEQVQAFKTGEKYQKLVKYYDNCLAAKDCVIKQLKLELAELRAQYIDIRNSWLEVTEDIEKEHKKAISQKTRIIDTLQKALWAAQKTIDDLKAKLLVQKKEMYKVQTELEDEKGKVLKLKAQINRDYENSGIPSSQKPNRKKIINNREKTGRKPGGQQGHKGHHRRAYTPTRREEIEPAREHLHPDFKETGKIITKQLVNIRVSLDITEYFTPEFRDRVTGQRVHATFPEGLVNEVTYGGSVKAFAFLLNNRCNVSIEKTSDLIAELTSGELKLSAGMINRLTKDFSEKSEPEQKKTFADMLLAPAIHTDFTTAKVNGKNMAVLVCANDTGVIYFAKNHKGHEGVKDTPIETYQGTLIHDHDKTFYSYGDNHQECLEHVRRYLKDSIQNEPKLKWNSQRRPLINEMIHFKNNLDPDDNRNPDQIEPAKVSEFADIYDEILKLAEAEYEYEPPTKYYPEGFNLYKRLDKYKSNHLLFLYRKDIDPTNNLSERLLRIFKRKQQQVMAFRSCTGLDFLCDSLGVIATLVSHGDGLYQRVSAIFDRREVPSST
jgi:hypothetical protein